MLGCPCSKAIFIAPANVRPWAAHRTGKEVPRCKTPLVEIDFIETAGVRARTVALGYGEGARACDCIVWGSSLWPPAQGIIDAAALSDPSASRMIGDQVDHRDGGVGGFLALVADFSACAGFGLGVGVAREDSKGAGHAGVERDAQQTG